MFCSRSGVMDRPFQMASIFLLFNSVSLLSQSMGLNSTSMPKRLDASLAMSMSKPTSSPLSSWNPKGGKLSSRPMTIFPFCAVAPLSVCLSPPQPATKVAVRSATMPAAAYFLHSMIIRSLEII